MRTLQPPRRRMHRRAPLRLAMAVLTMLPLMQSCTAPPPAVSSACGWETPFYPDPGFEGRWTHNEKLWAVDHNDKLAAACPESKP